METALRSGRRVLLLVAAAGLALTGWSARESPATAGRLSFLQSGASLDGVFLPDGRHVRIGDPAAPLLGVFTRAEGHDAAGRPLASAMWQGGPGLFAAVDDGGTFAVDDDRVAGFVLTPDAGVGDYVGAPGLRPGVSLERLRALVPGLTEARFDGEPALARQAGTVTTYFVQARRYGGADQCRLAPAVGVIAMVTERSRPLVEQWLRFDCDPAVSYD